MSLYSSDDRLYDSNGDLVSLTRYHDDLSKDYQETISGGTATVDKFDQTGNLIREVVTHADQSQDISTFGILNKTYSATHVTYELQSRPGRGRLLDE